MVFVSITRLRIRSIRFMPRFLLHTFQTNRQVQRADGFRGGSLLADRRWTFWTMTLWDDEASMRAYMLAGSHKRAMPHLVAWCDEASVAHWTQDGDDLPSWAEADRRMRDTGRPSKLRHPSEDHADLDYAAPRLTGAAPIRPVCKQA